MKFKKVLALLVLLLMFTPKILATEVKIELGDPYLLEMMQALGNNARVVEYRFLCKNCNKNYLVYRPIKNSIIDSKSTERQCTRCKEIMDITNNLKIYKLSDEHFQQVFNGKEILFR